MTDTIATDVAQELAAGFDCDGLEYVGRTFISKHRWYSRKLIAFKDGEDAYGFYYDEPATEDQEGQDVFEADPVPVFPVRVETVTVQKWVRDAG